MQEVLPNGQWSKDRDFVLRQFVRRWYNQGLSDAEFEDGSHYRWGHFSHNGHDFVLWCPVTRKSQRLLNRDQKARPGLRKAPVKEIPLGRIGDHWVRMKLVGPSGIITKSGRDLFHVRREMLLDEKTGWEPVEGVPRSVVRPKPRDEYSPAQLKRVEYAKHMIRWIESSYAAGLPVMPGALYQWRQELKAATSLVTVEVKTQSLTGLPFINENGLLEQHFVRTRVGPGSRKIYRQLPDGTIEKFLGLRLKDYEMMEKACGEYADKRMPDYMVADAFEQEWERTNARSLDSLLAWFEDQDWYQRGFGVISDGPNSAGIRVLCIDRISEEEVADRQTQRALDAAEEGEPEISDEELEWLYASLSEEE